MRSDAGIRLAAVLLLLVSCASSDGVMYAFAGKKAGSGHNLGAVDPGPADPGASDEGIGAESDACVPDWQCEGWSECTCGGTQWRTCRDRNACGTTAGRPEEI